MKKLILIVLWLASVGLEAEYNGCIQKGVRTPKYKNMSSTEFAIACKSISDVERTWGTINLDGTVPADSTFAKRSSSKRFRGMDYFEIRKECLNMKSTWNLSFEEDSDCTFSYYFSNRYQEIKMLAKIKAEKERVENIKAEKQQLLRDRSKFRVK